jgi:hypothetical protein
MDLVAHLEANDITEKASWDLQPISRFTSRAFYHVNETQLPYLWVIRITDTNDRRAPREGDVEAFVKHLAAALPNYGFRREITPQIVDVVKSGNKNPKARREEFAKSLDAAYTKLCRVGKPNLVVVALSPKMQLFMQTSSIGQIVLNGCQQSVSVLTLFRETHKDLAQMGISMCWGIFGKSEMPPCARECSLKYSSLKVNFKLRGINHILHDKAWYGSKPNTMIVGADVSHVKGDDTTVPSMAGMVATTDGQDCQFYASARLQSNNVEVNNPYALVFSAKNGLSLSKGSLV